MFKICISFCCIFCQFWVSFCLIFSHYLSQFSWHFAMDSFCLFGKNFFAYHAGKCTFVKLRKSPFFVETHAVHMQNTKFTNKIVKRRKCWKVSKKIRSSDSTSLLNGRSGPFSLMTTQFVFLFFGSIP